MAFTPTAFPGSGALLASTMKQNDDNLRKYLHEGIVSGDLQSSPAWIDTQHIHPPKYQPITNIQHGVTGHQGGRTYRPGRWYTMTTASMTRKGRGTSTPSWAEVPMTGLTFDLRGGSTAIFHYHFTVFVQPDTTTLSGSAADKDRRVYVAPYFRLGDDPFKKSQVYEAGALEVRMNMGTPTPSSSVGASGFRTPGTFPSGSGARTVFNVWGYGERTGQYMKTILAPSITTGQAHFGLAHWSLAHVGLVTSWSVCVEAYY